MTVYITVFVIIALISLKGFIKPSKIDNILGWCATIIIILFVGLRWERWTDWGAYYAYFKEPYGDFEIGFRWLSMSIKSIYDNYTFFLLLISTFIFVAFYRFVRYENKHFLISFLPIISLFTLGIGGVRQYIAFAVFLIAFKYAIDKKWMYYFFFLFVAILFHRTAIVLVIILFVPRKLFSYKLILLMFLTGIIFSQLGLINVIIDYLVEYTGGLLGGTGYYNKLVSYSVNKGGENAGIMGYLKKGTYVFAFLFFRKNSKKIFKNYDYYLNIYLVGIFIYLMSRGVIESFARFAMYFSLFELVLLPISFFSIKNKYLRLIAAGGIVVVCMMNYFFAILNHYPELYLPYRSIFY